MLPSSLDMEGVTAYVYADSYAEQFCIDHNVRYELLEDEPEEEIFTYTLDSDGNATITGLVSEGIEFPDGVLTIPATIQEHPVKTIGEEAFMNIGAERIELAEGVQSIGSRAFAGSRVKDITIPATVTDIAADAFEDCGALVIYGYAGSAAEVFAEAYGFRFYRLDR